MDRRNKSSSLTKEAETMRRAIYAIVGVAYFSCVVPAGSAGPVAQSRFVCQETVSCGPSVRVDGSKVILDRSLIVKFAKKPTLEMLEKNLWEIVYFVSIFDKEAMSAAIDLLATVDPKQVQIDDHHGIRPLARTLTNQYQFWEVLATKPLPVRRKVIQYFDINKHDYTLGYDYEEEKKKMLSADKK